MSGEIFRDLEVDIQYGLYGLYLLKLGTLDVVQQRLCKKLVTHKIRIPKKRFLDYRKTLKNTRMILKYLQEEDKGDQPCTRFEMIEYWIQMCRNECKKI